MDRLTPADLDDSPAPGENTIAYHLSHIHETRYWWLSQISKESASKLGDLFIEEDGKYTPSHDLALVKKELRISSNKIAEIVEQHLASAIAPAGPYDNAVVFLQHMLWHEGWHVGLIMLALRQAGKEPPEEWEDAHIWQVWRGVEE